MNAIVFDTLKHSRKLKEAGMPEREAEVQAEAIAELVEERLVTKQDLKELEYRLTIRLGNYSAPLGFCSLARREKRRIRSI